MDVELGVNDSLSIHSFHSSDIIPTAEVDVILNHFESALRSIIRNLHGSMHDVDLITDSEMSMLISPQYPNGGVNVEDQSSYPPCHILGPIRNVSQMVELQVEKTPRRIAVSDI